MRILLVNAGWGALFSGRVRRYNRRFPPLSLLNCAAILRQQHGVTATVVDFRARPQQQVDADDYDLIICTLSPLDRWQCPNTDLEQVRRAVAPYPPEKLVIMGAQVTIRPETLLETTGAWGAILGEPESIVAALADGQRPGDAPGTAQLREGTLHKGPSAPSVEMDELPLPAFDLIDFGDYHYEVLGGDFGLLELTRGCPWSCKYCLLTMYGKRYRKKGTQQLRAEVQDAMSRGMKRAYFQDLEFTVDHPLVYEMCDAIQDLGLIWSCQTRPDTVDAKLLKRMKAAGCELVHFGVESGSDRILALTEKRQSKDAVRAGMAAAREAGMRTLCYFLVGLPSETPDEMRQTLAFAEELRPTYASFQVATPYPTTPFHMEHEFTDPLPVAFDGPLNEQELRALARRFTLRYHLNPRYLWTRATTPGRRQAVREAGLLVRYAMS